MTVLTKAFSDKKQEKLFTASTKQDPENGDDVVLVNGQPTHRRRHTLSTVFLAMAACTVLSLGIITGLSIYRSYGRAQMERMMRFHGYRDIPYDRNEVEEQTMVFMNSKYNDDDEEIRQELNSESMLLKQIFNEAISKQFFKEEFELDISDDESYSKITVPDFRDGRSGRYLHDFKYNQSMIADKDNLRCFVMPLDRERILQPKTMYDLLTKLMHGYYSIDTERVRKNMRVVLPAVTDLTTIAPRILNECSDSKIYMLENYVTGVFKRSIKELPDDGKFAEFGGNKIIEVDVVNYDQLVAYERGNN